MWPFRKKQTDVFTISLTPQNIICCLFSIHKTQTKKYVIKAYERTPLKKLEFSQAIVFNPTKLASIISNFAQKNECADISATLSVNGPLIVDNIVNVSVASPKPESFHMPNLQTLKWESLYLCPSVRGGFDFLVCGIKPELLFSYQLLAFMAGVKVASISTEQAAHVNLYKIHQGQHFRQTILAQDLAKNRYNLKPYFDIESIDTLVNVDTNIPFDLFQEYQFLSTSLGLSLS